MITKPTLLLDEKKCRKNIKTMYQKAQMAQVDFRPQFKTHQSLEVSTWYKELGVDKITVSSFTMADYFATEWNDITVAFPINILEIDTINRLAEKIHLNVLIESTETVHFLKDRLKHKVGFFIKVDVGFHRAGVDITDTTTIDQILEVTETTDRLTFKGFLAHAGHTYHCDNSQDVLTIHRESLASMAVLKQSYLDRYPEIIVSTGDTPSCSLANEFKGSDEIRPGNFTFYDLTQHSIGVCNIGQIAVAMACPVVAIHPERNELTIYGGGVHFSKDFLKMPSVGMTFGAVVESQKNGWSDKLVSGMYLKRLSQEHGILNVPEDQLGNYQIGDVLLILPVHSCMSADAMKSYTTTEDSRKITRL